MLARSDKGKKIKVHFMGVGGSALSGVSIMAQKKGFLVSGCDLDPDTAYLDKVKEAGIKVMRGHDERHLKDVDILAVSPAVVYQNKKHPEYTTAKKSGILKTWDQFVGKYLLSDKEVICVTGTHGKSTVTSMASLLLEKANFDPGVIVGATVMEWGKNFRVGDGNIFIIEADDFYEKFLNYNPSTIILNNIEFDHPDFFRSEKHMVSVYEKFVRLLKGSKNLIINQDSPGNKKLIDSLDEDFLRSINIYGYSLSGRPLFEVVNSIRVKDMKKSKHSTEFRITDKDLDKNEKYRLTFPGEYNIENSMGVIILGKLYGIEYSTVYDVLAGFKGTGRRLERIGKKRNVVVYDDYAHHPTAYKATLGAVRQKYPKEKVWAVVEPHSYSRTKALLDDYANAFGDADEVIITPIFKARDESTFGISEKSITDIIGDKASYIDSFEKISNHVSNSATNGDVVLVMGAGKSYKLAKQILSSL